jgi:hypothetical protein
MRVPALVITAAIVLSAIVLVALLRPGPVAIDANEASEESVIIPVAALPGSPASPVANTNAVSDSAAIAESPTPTYDRGPATTSTPLPGEVPVMPIAELLESAEREVPPGLIQREQAFAAEPVDVDWAPAAEADILSRVAQMPDRALLSLQVECRSATCRFQAAAPASSEGFNILIDSLGLEARVKVAIIDPSGAIQSVAYLSRGDISDE